MQKAYGNQAMLQMMGRSLGKPSVTASPLSQGGILQRKCACGNTAVSSGTCAACQKNSGMALPEKIQTKLTINQPGDHYEQEADRIADQVLATPTHSVVSDAPPRIQRFSGQTTGRADIAAPANIDCVLSSPGSPLEPSLQQDMEQRLGHDFSSVRVHTDEPADRSAREVNANAYTVGRNIVFGAGRYAPGTHEGRRLIAHELTHTVQQNAARNLGSDAKREQLSTVGGRLVQRDGEFNVPTLDELYNSALQAARQTGNWQDAAEKLNGFNHEDIQSHLAQLTQDEVGYIHQGALDNPRVGPQSQVAQLTEPGTPRASTLPQSGYHQAQAFVQGAINATTEDDLKEAGEALADAVATGGIALVIGLITHAGGEVPPGRAPFKAPPSEGFMDALTADGQIVRVPEEAQKSAPADLALKQSKGAAGGPAKSGGAGSVGRIISETRVGGKTVIKSEIGLPPGKRLGTENLLPRGVEVGRQGWQRAHSQGQITGAESGEGILLAPEEVNQGLQRLGIEQYVSDLNSQKATDTSIFMTTETNARVGTLALESIKYRIEASRPSVNGGR